MTYHIGPYESAVIWGMMAFYLIAREWQRLAGAFFLGKSTAPWPPKKLWTSTRLAVAGRGLWVVMVGYSLWSYVLPQLKMNADIGERQSPLCGVYRVERFVSDGRVLPEGVADPERWREVAIDRFGDYIRIRRMDEFELLWSADPGDPYRFMVASGHDYKYGDYGKILAKTAGVHDQLRFKALPNFRSPDGPRGDQLFTLDFVRSDSDAVSVEGRIDGAEISADLRRIDNDNFAFFGSRKGLP